MGASQQETDVFFDTAPYYSKGAILELAPHLGYDDLIAKSEKLAPRFWGIESGTSLIPPVPDVQNRLIQIKNILKEAPFVAEFGHTASWAFETPAEEIKSTGERNQHHVLRRASRPRKSGPQDNTEPHITYLEAYRNERVAAHVLKSLQSEGDPLAETIIALIDWRLRPETPKPNLLFEQLGHAAFELVIFAARTEKVKAYVGEVALVSS